MSGIMKDLSFGFRMLIRTPMLSLVAVLTIGLGVGSTSFVYSATFGISNLPVENPGRLIRILRDTPAGSQDGLSFHDYLDIRDRQTVFSSLAAGYSGTLNLAGDDEPPQRLQGSFVTANAFDGLGVSPILGRSFQEGDDLPGAPNILLLGFDTWNNRFAADRDVLGRGVRVNGEPAIIIGVMPEGFGFPLLHDVWTPLRYDPATLPRAGGRALSVWGYLREGVSRGAANDELAAIMSRLELEFPELNEEISAHAVPYAEGALPPVARVIANLMLLMVAGVLLVACANVANLLLARATAREREVAIRTALGASRLRVIRQLLAEAVVIGIAGGFLGLLFNYLALQWFTVHVADIQAPYWVDYSLDPSVLIFTATVTVVAGLLAGTLPAIRASGAGVEIVLRDESRGSSSLRMGRFGAGLVVAELALSCALMIGAGLVARSVMTLNRIDPGFRVESIMTARLALFTTDYPERDARNRFYHDVLAAIRSDAATTAAALTSHLPGTGQARWRVQVEGATYPLPDDVPRAGGAVISHGFFETFGIATAEGRDFLPSESEMGGEPVAIVSRGFVERHMGGASALGRRIRLGANPNEANPWMRIVGVVPDTYQGMGRFGTEEQIQELIYLPLALAHPTRMSMAVRARDEPAVLATRLRQAVTGVDPDIPLGFVETMESAVEEANFIRRIFGTLSSFFSVVALFLTSVGLYGVIDFSVSSRLKETGIRMAIGADRGSIMRLVYGRVLRQLALGLVIGLALGTALARPMSAALVGIVMWDPLVYGSVVLALTLTAVAAALMPTLKAINVDPSDALRAE